MLKRIIKRIFSIDKIESVSKDVEQIKGMISHFASQNDIWNKIRMNLELIEKYPGKTIQEAKRALLSEYPKATGFLYDVQRCNLKLLTELKKECDELNIKFWLHAGTLIGALRHGGFIPWDDDVDIGMERSDFNVLREHLKISSRFVLLELYNQKTCSRQYQLKYKNEIPCFIDIAIWERSNAKSPVQIKEHREKFVEIRRQLLNKFNDLQVPAIIDIGYYMVGLYEGDVKSKVDSIIDDAVRSFLFDEDDDEYSLFYSIENYPFAYPVMLHSQCYPLKLMHFENQLFYVPQDSEIYLKGYGDIYLPPCDIGRCEHLYAFAPYKKLIEKFVEEDNYE